MGSLPTPKGVVNASRPSVFIPEGCAECINLKKADREIYALRDEIISYRQTIDRIYDITRQTDLMASESALRTRILSIRTLIEPFFGKS